MAIAAGTLLTVGAGLYTASKQRKAGAKAARNSLAFQQEQAALLEEQKETILKLLDGLNDATTGNVKAGIKGLDINSMNYEATIRKLEQMKENK